MTKQTKPHLQTGLIVAAIVVAVIAAGLVLRNTFAPSIDAETPKEREEKSVIRRTRSAAQADNDRSRPSSAGTSRNTAATTRTAAGSSASANTVESKTQFFIDNWEGGAKRPDSYKQENVVQTPEGLTLAPPDPAAENGQPTLRKGVIESPPLQLEFPSNYMMPLWREKGAEDLGVRVEMAIGPDGNEWSQWFPLEPNGDEISPTFPDGTPNPNYGFIGGTGITNGTRLYGYAKYRVTLTSTNKDAAPVLQQFKIYYVDSTGADGVIADKVENPAPPPPTGQ